MQEYSLEHNIKDTFFTSGLQDIFLKFNFDIVTTVLLMKICNVVFKLSNCITRQLFRIVAIFRSMNVNSVPNG